MAGGGSLDSMDVRVTETWQPPGAEIALAGLADRVNRALDPTRYRISSGRRKLPRLGQPKPERFESGAILTREDTKTNPHANDANSV